METGHRKIRALTSALHTMQHFWQTKGFIQVSSSRQEIAFAHSKDQERPPRSSQPDLRHPSSFSVAFSLPEWYQKLLPELWQCQIILMWWEENSTRFTSQTTTAVEWWWSTVAFLFFAGSWRWLGDSFVVNVFYVQAKSWSNWVGYWWRKDEVSGLKVEAGWRGQVPHVMGSRSQGSGLEWRYIMVRWKLSVVSCLISGVADMWILIQAWASSRCKWQRWMQGQRWAVGGQRYSSRSGQGLFLDTVFHQI